MSQDSPCCQSKMVGEVNYTLVDTRDTSRWGCKDDCVYTTLEGGLICFKPGELLVSCQDDMEGGAWPEGGTWPQEPEVQNNYTAKGKMVDLDPGMKAYLVGSGQKVIIWSTDIYGITDENIANKRTTKEWADYLADEGGYTVLIPDWFRGNNMPATGMSMEWFGEITNWTRIENDWTNVVLPYLEEKISSPISIGLIGTCWGSFPVVMLSRFENIKCGISMHPSHDKLIGLAGQEESDVLSQIEAPQLFMTEGGVGESLLEGGLADQILGDKIQFEEFPEMAHGWTVGGNLSDPAVARDVERAKTLALDFFSKYL